MMEINPNSHCKQKTQIDFDFLKKQDWTLGEFLHHAKFAQMQSEGFITTL